MGQSREPPRKPYSSIAMETPVEVGSPPRSAPVGPVRSQEQSFPTTMELGGQFAVTPPESLAVLDTGSTANSVCYKWLGNRNLFLGKQGFARAGSYPSAAQFKFGAGRIGEVKRAADIIVGMASS